MTIKQKICVIGAGGWGRNHINTLNKLNCLYGIIDTDKSILNTYQDINSYCKFFNNIDSSFDEDFDGYIIATPAETHYYIAKKLISHSKNILIEKPVCLTSKHANELYSLSIQNNSFIMGGHLLLFHPAFLKIKELLKIIKLEI